MIAIGLSLVMVLAFMAPADAQQRTTISGDAVPSDCNGERGAGGLELTGDLEGCLIFFPKRFDCQELNGFARYQEWGSELFIGSYDGDRGRFRTRYHVDSTYTAGSCAEFEAGGFPFLNQLTGGCTHKVKGKKGAFAGMRGLINFFDVIPDPGTSGASNFLYAGWLR